MAKCFNMTTSKEIHRAVNRVANMVLNGELESKAANAILYACNVSLGAIRTDEQQAKLDEMERLIKEMEDSERR